MDVSAAVFSPVSADAMEAVEAVEAVEAGVEEVAGDAVVAVDPLFEAVELEARSGEEATCFAELLSV